MHWWNTQMVAGCECWRALWFRRAISWTAGLAILAACGLAEAQVTRSVGPVDIIFYNNGQSDEDGTSTQDWTTQEMDDAMGSVLTWVSGLGNTAGRHVRVHLLWSNLGSVILGQTTSPRVGDGTTSSSYAERVWREGVNYSSTPSYDIRTELSTGAGFSVGTGFPGVGQTDFRSIVTHELGHGLGFESTYDPATDTFTNVGLSTFDRNLLDNLGNGPSPNSHGFPGNFNQVANPVFFTGANAVAVNGGNVPVYAPNPYEDGSSLTHLDENTYPNALMAPQRGSEVVRTPTPLEWAMMQDFGWTVIPNRTWNKGAGTLNWGDAANWSPSGAPDQNSNALFTSLGLASGNAISLGANRTVSTLMFDGSVGFTLGGSSNTLTVRSGNIIRSGASSGTQSVASPVVLGAQGLWDIGGTGQLTFAGAMSGPSSIEKIGEGTVVLGGTSNFAGNVTVNDGVMAFGGAASVTGNLVINDGTVTAGVDLGVNPGEVTLLSGGSLSVSSVSGAGALNFDGGSLNLTGSNSIHIGGVRVGRDATATFTIAPGKSLTTDIFLTVGRNSGAQGTVINQGTMTALTNITLGVSTGASGAYIQQTGPGGSAPTTTVANITYVGGFPNSTGGTGLLQLQSGAFTTLGLEVGYISPGAVTQTGGTMTVTGTFDIASAAQGTYNLNGGTLKTGTLNVGTGAAALNFGGGILQATAAFSTPVPVTINAGGGIINTSGVALSLSGPVNYAAGTLSKIGNSTLTLSGPQTWGIGGGAAVQGGTLSYTLTSGDTVAVAGLSTVTMASSTTLVLGGTVAALSDGTHFVNVVNGSGATLSVTGANQAAGIIDGTGNTVVAPAADLTATRLRQNQLTIGSSPGSSAKAVIRATANANTSSSTSRLGSMSIAGGAAPTSTLDLNNNSLVIDYVGSVGSILTTVTAQIASARNGKDGNDQANWNGKGIVTSAGRAANVAATVDRYNLGAINNADLTLAGIGPPLTTLAGQTVAPSTVLVKYTYSGDANLDGTVDGDDYSYWLNGFLDTTNASIQGWLRGDFDYNGVIDGDDYTQWLNSFLFAGPPLVGSAGPVAVPEPATLGLLGTLGLCLMGFAGRRWRKTLC